MNNLEDIKLEVGRFNFISIFDANSLYWQLEVRPEDRWLTAFATNDDLYKWVRVPFGTKNSGSIFVRPVQQILYPIRKNHT